MQRIFFFLLWDALPLCRMALRDRDHLLALLSGATHSSAIWDPAANIKQGFGAGSDYKSTLAPGQGCAQWTEPRVFALALPATAPLGRASGGLAAPSPAWTTAASPTFAAEWGRLGGPPTTRLLLLHPLPPCRNPSAPRSWTCSKARRCLF